MTIRDKTSRIHGIICSLWVEDTEMFCKSDQIVSDKVLGMSSPSITNPSFENSSFRKYLDIIWPIKNEELPKFLMITLLMFCILGIQNLIRAMKDSVIITMIGAETTSFLKFWGVMPAAFLITIIYIKLVSVMRAERIFYIILTFFISFFALFGFFLFPNYEYIHLSTEKSLMLSEAYPHFKWFIFLLSSWSFSLFYIIAELWPNAVFALLFWQFVNKITTIDQSKRFYFLFGLLGQTGLIVSGIFLQNLRSIDQFFIDIFKLNIQEDVLSVQIVISVVVILGVLSIFAFWFINAKIIDTETSDLLKFRVKKNQMSLKESVKMIAYSRYIRLIAILLVSYGLAINLVEGPWKKMAERLYPNPTEYISFVGGYLSYTGFVTITFVLIGSYIVRRFGWFTAAIITPFVMMITGGLFFSSSNFDFVSSSMMLFFMMSDPLMLAVILGAVQNVISKSAKYTLFDSTKEMSYVPLDDELKTKGKAAADMIGSKLGKSLSAFIQSLIFTFIPTATYISLSFYLMIIFVLISLVWIWAIFQLNVEYKNACNMHKAEEIIF